MSVKVMDLVWQYAREVHGNDLVVLLALADWANDEGQCWPSIGKLADKARVSERTVQYVLRRLGEDGYIQVNAGVGRSHTSYYTVNVALLRSQKKAQELHQSEQEKVQELQDIDVERVQTLHPEKVQNQVEKVQNPAIKGAIAIAPDPLLDPSIDPSVSSVVANAPTKQQRKHRIPEDFGEYP